jgi:hypothetical protein
MTTAPFRSGNFADHTELAKSRYTVIYILYTLYLLLAHLVFGNLQIAVLRIWNSLGIFYPPITLSTKSKCCLKHPVFKNTIFTVLYTLKHRICSQQRTKLSLYTFWSLNFSITDARKRNSENILLCVGLKLRLSGQENNTRCGCLREGT